MINMTYYKYKADVGYAVPEQAFTEILLIHAYNRLMMKNGISDAASGFRKFQEKVPPAPLTLPAATIQAFDALSQGPSRPHPLALEHAESWAENFYEELADYEYRWKTPHITVQDGEDVVFEWWNGRKSLTVYFSPDESWFLQSAGAGSEFGEGNPDEREERFGMWRWLSE